MTPAPGRDELREQVAAALVNSSAVVNLALGRFAADAVPPVVDAWVAGHTAEAGAAHTTRRLREQYPENGPLGDRKVAADETPTTEIERLHRLASHRLSSMTDGKRAVRDLAAAVARVRALCDQRRRAGQPTVPIDDLRPLLGDDS